LDIKLIRPKFSILICHIDSRKKELDRLMKILNPQVENNPIEILIESDNGKMKIGKKRNILVSKAKGDFIAFIDDDDRVSDKYVDLILSSLQNNTDVLGIEGIFTTDGANPKKFIHSIKYKHWFQKGDIYYRNPNHLNPVKRELAKRIRFPEIDHREDRDYSRRLYSLLRKEIYIKNPIYFYDYRKKK